MRAFFGEGFGAGAVPSPKFARFAPQIVDPPQGRVEDIYRRSLIISRAALWPGAPVTPPPGWVPEPHI